VLEPLALIWVTLAKPLTWTGAPALLVVSLRAGWSSRSPSTRQRAGELPAAGDLRHPGQGDDDGRGVRSKRSGTVDAARNRRSVAGLAVLVGSPIRLLRLQLLRWLTGGAAPHSRSGWN
jgi:hypothetical protein